VEPLSHIPVLLNEAMEVLSPQPGDVVVDCTVGLGGHSEAIAAKMAPQGRIIGFDLDPANLARAAERLTLSHVAFTPIQANFVSVPAHLAQLHFKADIVFADLGFSSTQMDDPDRGFSFNEEGPLDMRLDPTASLTAADLVNGSSERELADIIFQYGEDPLARKIARKLAQNRQPEPILTTARLARLVQEAYGSRARTSRMHPATRTFMALRIAVNDELGALRGLLEWISRNAEPEKISADGCLNSGARVAIISFHSLEDRMVKHAFADLAKRGLATRLTKKPIGPSETETTANPRSRSAKLRTVRIGDSASPQIQPSAG
jgi:16S rRNA (cytosine1402-N4)-methyltransferase